MVNKSLTFKLDQVLMYSYRAHRQYSPPGLLPAARHLLPPPGRHGAELLLPMQWLALGLASLTRCPCAVNNLPNHNQRSRASGQRNEQIVNKPVGKCVYTAVGPLTHSCCQDNSKTWWEQLCVGTCVFSNLPDDTRRIHGFWPGLRSENCHQW